MNFWITEKLITHSKLDKEVFEMVISLPALSKQVSINSNLSKAMNQTLYYLVFTKHLFSQLLEMILCDYILH